MAFGVLATTYNNSKPQLTTAAETEDTFQRVYGMPGEKDQWAGDVH